MNLDVARTLLAGWLAGAVVGLGDTALLLVLLARHPAASGGLASRLSGARVRLPVIGMVVANGLVISWTLAGLLMGAIALKVAMPAFAGVALGLSLAPALVYTFVRGTGHRGELAFAWGTSFLATFAFAVLLPWLAERH